MSEKVGSYIKTRREDDDDCLVGRSSGVLAGESRFSPTRLPVMEHCSLLLLRLLLRRPLVLSDAVASDGFRGQSVCGDGCKLGLRTHSALSRKSRTSSVARSGPDP